MSASRLRTSRVTRTVLGIAAVMVSALFLAGPSAAASSHRPDGWIRTEGYHSGGTNYPHRGPWQGQDIYNATALNQKATYKFVGAFLSGDYLYFTVNVQNDGSASDRFKVHGGGGQGYKYFHGTTNITSAVAAGTFKTTSLSHGASFSVTVRIITQFAYQDLVTITSVGDPTKSDAVKAVVKVSCGC